jgi:beta-glucanase (GH16 family)
MKKIVWIVLFYVALAHPVLAQPAELNGKIRFAWGDEFNGTTINENMWRVVDNSDNYADGNGGVAVARNVSVSGGYLNCTVKRETYYCPPNYVDSNFCMRQLVQNGIPYDFTYGRIDSKAPYNHQYGYAEASMHFSNQPGLWPAFWTSIGEGIGPRFSAGEIDIMERVFESNDAKTVTTNVHLNYCPDGPGTTSCPFDLGAFCATSLGCYGHKHTLVNECWNATKYALYWSPTELIFYINDVRVRTMDNPGVVDIVKFILGMGVASKYVTSNTILPSTLYVDYIHVYDLHECIYNPTLPIGQTLVNNDGTQNIMVACMKIDGNGTNGGKMNLVATKSVALLPSFGVKEGGYLEARISSTGREQNTEELPKKYYPLHMQGQTNTVVAPEQAATEELFTISPNPIVSTASIKYSIAKQAAVKITLYNIMGIVQDELVSENQLAGEYAYELDATNYKAGIYLLVFESGGTTQKRTVVITK